MTIPVLLVTSAVLLGLAYRWYGAFVAEKLQISDDNITPANTLRDDVDYVPTKAPVVLGHHFASIAGAGPIVGPILAAAFGWVPALLWILIGGVFFGAVQDITSLIASVRHQGKSIGEIIHRYMGDWGKRLFLIFAFATLILVIAVFMDIVAKTFVAVPSAASASVAILVLSVLVGLSLKRFGAYFSIVSGAGVLIMFALVMASGTLPLELSYWTWIAVLLGYIFVSSVAPIWILLQPRDYLNSFLLYGMMILGVVGIFVAQPEIKMSAQSDFSVENLGYMFPVLFVTIACGAVSGFHSLVSSGTTSKQLRCESDAKLIGFGGMLIESFLAVIALSTVMIFSREAYMTRLLEAGPVTVFSEGLGGFMSSLGLPVSAATSFVALTVSAFALTSLDTCTRLARYCFQEYFESERIAWARPLASNRYIATFSAVAFSFLLVLSGSFTDLWPIFGSANQLLGALALLAVTVWLSQLNINALFTFVPMVFMFAVTLTSLSLFAWHHFSEHSYLLGSIALVLFVLSVALIYLAKRSLVKVFRSGLTEEVGAVTPS